MNFNEKHLSYKSKMVLLSVVSLFVAKTESLPTKIAILGMDLSANPAVTGWFIFGASFYFFIMTFIFGGLDIIKYKQPTIVKHLGRKVTGKTLGLTEEECLQANHQSYQVNESEFGTIRQEFEDIQHERTHIKNQVRLQYQNTYDWLIIGFYYLLPIILYFTSQYYLFRFLYL